MCVGNSFCMRSASLLEETTRRKLIRLVIYFTWLTWLRIQSGLFNPLWLIQIISSLQEEGIRKRESVIVKPNTKKSIVFKVLMFKSTQSQTMNFIDWRDISCLCITWTQAVNQWPISMEKKCKSKRTTINILSRKANRQSSSMMTQIDWLLIRKNWRGKTAWLN